MGGAQPQGRMAECPSVGWKCRDLDTQAAPETAMACWSGPAAWLIRAHGELAAALADDGDS